MRLVLLTALVMVAFAANSVLNRMALAGGGTGPAAFALVRLGAGAAVLVALAQLRHGGAAWRGAGRLAGATSLALYMLGFSFAYTALDAGTGALILFGGVQLTMFAGALISGERPGHKRYLGAAVAFAGLLVLFWPSGAGRIDPFAFALMAAAAAGWGVYSLAGRKATLPLAETAANFTYASPVAVIALLLAGGALDARGAALAVVSGAMTSGLGYALWYAVLPQLAATVAAVAQLTVPVIALAGGMALLGEPLTARYVAAAALVLGGVALSLFRFRAR